MQKTSEHCARVRKVSVSRVTAFTESFRSSWSRAATSLMAMEAVQEHLRREVRGLIFWNCACKARYRALISPYYFRPMYRHSQQRCAPLCKTDDQSRTVGLSVLRPATCNSVDFLRIRTKGDCFFTSWTLLLSERLNTLIKWVLMYCSTRYPSVYKAETFNLWI